MTHLCHCLCLGQLHRAPPHRAQRQRRGLLARHALARADQVGGRDLQGVLVVLFGGDGGPLRPNLGRGRGSERREKNKEDKRIKKTG
jgi:hypothetical protein